MSDFIENSDKQEDPHVFIQWKGTDICMDFYCECGAHCHFDGFFAYAVKCPHCNVIWQMPCFVKPRKMEPGHGQYWYEKAKPLDPDEDHSSEAVGKDGITRLLPHPVPK